MDALIGLMNGLSGRWAGGMWLVLWQTAILAAVVYLLTRCLHRAPAALRFWLWMLVPLRLLVMPLVTLSLPVLPPEPAGLGAHMSATPAVVLQQPAAGLSTEGTATMPPAELGLDTDVATATPDNAAPYSRNIWTWLMAAWITGLGVFSLRLAVGWRRMARIVAQAAEPRDPAVVAIAREAAQMLGLPRVPRILVTSENVSPFVFGLSRPVVVLPVALMRQVSSDELLAVLTHEFVHIRRRDPLIGWVLAFCEVLYFFHPALHLAKRQIMFERERACDDHVLALGRASRSAYARVLVSAADVCSPAQRHVSPVAVLAESFDNLRKRLKVLGSDRKLTAHLSRRTVMLVAVLTIACLPGVVLTARAQVQEPRQKPNETLQASEANSPELSKLKAELMERVEHFFMNNFKDITSRKPIEWGDVTMHENGNRSIRYKYYATIWDRDTIIDNKVFTFDLKGNFVSVKNVEGFPKKESAAPESTASPQREPALKPDAASGEITVTVSGRVFDKLTAQPLPGALIRGHVTNYRLLISRQPDVFDRSCYAETRTDRKGAYQLSFIVPVTTSGPREEIGSVCVDASATGYETKPQYARPHVTQENTDYSNVNFAMGPGRRVHGKVVDEDGRPLAGALVSVNNGWNGDWHYFGSLGSTKTDKEGRFELYCSNDRETIGRRAWLKILKEGYGQGYVTDILKKEDLETVVIPRGGTIVGRVVDKDGRGVRNCEIMARPGYLRPVSRALTDADGRYELKGVPGEEVRREFYTWKNKRYLRQWATFSVYARRDPGMALDNAAHYDIVVQAGKTMTAPDLVVGPETGGVK